MYHHLSLWSSWAVQFSYTQWSQYNYEVCGYVRPSSTHGVKITVSVWSSGVGLFVCLHGVVAREVRAQMVTRTTARQYFSGVLHTIRSVVPLVVLGCARLVATWGVQYQEHVSEYGVHWNFFFTLAIVKVSCPHFLYPCLVMRPVYALSENLIIQ